MRSETSPSVQDAPSFIEEARRAQIVECAIETIAELGYEHASLAEIAKRARVSKSAILYYFADKDELIGQVVTAVYTAAGEYMLPRLEQEKTARGALQQFILTNIQFIAANFREVQAVMEIVSSARTPEGRPRYDVRGLEESMSGIEEMLRWGQKNGEFRKFSVPVMAVALRTAIDALGPRMLAYPDLDPEEYGAELATMFDLATRKGS